MMNRVGLEAEATPEQAELFLNKISELVEKLTDRRNHQSRIRGMLRDAEEFARDVEALAARVGWRSHRSSCQRAGPRTRSDGYETPRPMRSKGQHFSLNAGANRKRSTRPRFSTTRRGSAWNGSVTKRTVMNLAILSRPSAVRRISSGWRRLAQPARSSFWPPPLVWS